MFARPFTRLAIKTSGGSVQYADMKVCEKSVTRDSVFQPLKGPHSIIS
jgi:hypothetical protein